MMRRFLRSFSIIFFLLFYGCANQVSPTGGPKDIRPPEIKEMIPDNYSTNFQSRKIQLTFDEFIQLKDINTQLIVSPPLKYIPETKVRKGVLEFKIQDTLLANTTYSLNFGNAIQDLNEGNAIENFSYVFSTGPLVDTLSISGQVLLSTTQKPEKGVKVMLYQPFSDSLPYKDVPSYFSKTDEMGNFSIRNIANGKYKLFALKETNNNYLYDGNDESIAFLKRQVEAGEKEIRLELFTELPEPRLLRTQSAEPGKVILAMNRPLPEWNIKFLTDTSQMQIDGMFYSQMKDTLTIWYKNLLLDSLSAVLEFRGKQDTIYVRLIKADEKYLKRNKLSLKLQSNIASGQLFDLNAPIIVHFSHPIESFSPEKIVLLEDSTSVKPGRIYFSDTARQNLVITNLWKENTKYQIFIPPAAFTDIFGLANDSLLQFILTNSQIYYGSLQAKIFVRDDLSQHIFQLIDMHENIAQEFIFKNDTSFTLADLSPGTYKLRVVSDRNGNGRYDTGKYVESLQPEPVFYYTESVLVRSNWDVELVWEIKSNEAE